MESRTNYLIHFGIKGQKWGLRRFQNEDGTLTEEGKARYYDALTPNQKKIYDQKMSDKQKKQIIQKLSEGKSWTHAIREMNSEALAKRRAIVGAGIMVGLMLSDPITRGFIKASGKALFRTIKNTNAVQRGKLYIQQLLKRKNMLKTGGVVLKKSAYSIRDIPFGGYLH